VGAAQGVAEVTDEEINSIAERVAEKLRGDRLVLPGPDLSVRDIRRLTGLHENTLNGLCSSAEYRPISGGRIRLFRREEILFARRNGRPFLEYRRPQALSS
jgi:hypothetical protein